MYFIFYIKGTDYFTIHNFKEGTHFRKSINLNGKMSCEFVDWWIAIKGTIQTKMFYKKNEYSSWKINQILESYGLKWGGDIDGLVLNSDKKIMGIIEFRKTSYKRINEYDPADFYKGTKYRKGDYLTWYPLTQLSKEIGKQLILISLALTEPKKCGMTVVLTNDRYSLYYTNGLGPNLNTYDSFNLAYDDLIKIINDYCDWFNNYRSK